MQQKMSHHVPNLDVPSTECDDMHPCPLPVEKGEVASLFFCDGGGGVDHLGARKGAGTCISNGMVSHVPWLEAENEEKRGNVFELSRESVLASDVALSHTPFQEDELLSWLQYPLDDTFSKNYCSEQYCEPPFTSFSPQNLFEKLAGERLSTKLIENADANIGGQSACNTSDAALALGAQRAMGLAPQAGAEVFDRVNTIRQSCDDASSSKATDTVHTPNINHSALKKGGKRNTMNFPFFSQHVAEDKSSIQIVGASNSNKRTPSIEQSTSATCLTDFKPLGESGWNELKKGADTLAQRSVNNVKCQNLKARQAELDFTTYSQVIGTDFFETADATLTSFSGESDYSTGKSAKDVCGKRPAEETECESKDTRGIASQETGPPMPRTTSTKRTRAAEIHNQSERKRRNKINEKMKALQELIPNSNKTDKASMLDEAIEYVKMLQGQLQLMSMRTGMNVPPIMMPPGMQYLSLQQGPNTAGGLNMGLGSRVLDVSSSAVSVSPKPVFLGQPLPGHVYHHSAGYPPHGSPPVAHDMQSHLHLNAPAFQQFQQGHMQLSYQGNSDTGKR